MKSDYAIVIFGIGTLVLILFAFTLILFLLIHKRKRYEHLLEKQDMKNTYNNQLLQSRLEVQEQSFKYFSEEIHDNIGQLLSLVKMQLYNIKSSSKETEIVKKAASCNDLLGKAISDLRNISHTLSSVFVDKEGLSTAIEKDLEYIRSAKEIKCVLHTSGEEYDLGKEKELLIFRIVQEATANAIKHGSPTDISILLDYQPDIFKVVVKDNGSGFDRNALANAGLGLNNMQVRANLLKANLQIRSGIEIGTEISMEIALNADIPIQRKGGNKRRKENRPESE